MKCFSGKTCWANGLTLLEMVIAIAIIVVVFAALMPQFKNMSSSWASKQGNAEALQNGRVLVDYLNRNLAKATKVTAVSDSSETDGYIEFEDADAVTYRCDIAANNYVEFGVVGDLVHEAWHERNFVFPCKFGVDAREDAVVGFTVVRRQADAREQDLHVPRLGGLDDRREALADLREGQAAQSVVAAEFDDQDRRPVFVECGTEAVEPGARGIAADAGVDDPPSGVFAVEALLQQRDPALFLVDTIGGTDAVAEDQNG